jgi:hypothetical protein
MSDGNISDNIAASSGGGVYVRRAMFTMNGGTISGNNAYDSGGGVWVYAYDINGGTFTKQSGGVIYGSNASNVLRNIATSGNDYGHAVYVYSSPAKKRNTTAGIGVTLDSTKNGAAWGWE